MSGLHFDLPLKDETLLQNAFIVVIYLQYTYMLLSIAELLVKFTIGKLTRLMSEIRIDSTLPRHLLYGRTCFSQYYHGQSS